jgi:hypothetical protein
MGWRVGTFQDGEYMTWQLAEWASIQLTGWVRVNVGNRQSRQILNCHGDLKGQWEMEEE